MTADKPQVPELTDIIITLCDHIESGCTQVCDAPEYVGEARATAGRALESTPEPPTPCKHSHVTTNKMDPRVTVPYCTDCGKEMDENPGRKLAEAIFPSQAEPPTGKDEGLREFVEGLASTKGFGVGPVMLSIAKQARAALAHPTAPDREPTELQLMNLLTVMGRWQGDRAEVRDVWDEVARQVRGSK